MKLRSDELMMTRASGGGRPRSMILAHVPTGVALEVRDAGVPDRVAMSITNHRTPSVFLRYGIRHEQAQRAALESVESYLATLPNRSTVTPLGHTTDTPRSASRS